MKNLFSFSSVFLLMIGFVSGVAAYHVFADRLSADEVEQTMLQSPPDISKTAESDIPAASERSAEARPEAQAEAPAQVTAGTGSIGRSRAPAPVIDEESPVLIKLAKLARPNRPLSSEEFTWLSEQLHQLDRDGIMLAAHALIRNGGVAGFEAVMAYAADPDYSIEQRRRALDTIDNLPPELAAQLYPAIVEFLESETARELHYTGVHALARLLGDQSVDTLLSMAEDASGMGLDIIFDAIGATGRDHDIDTLLGLLSTDIDKPTRRGLMRALSEIAAYERNGVLLFDLLYQTTDNRSRRAIAEAIADASSIMDLDDLAEALMLTVYDERAQAEIATAFARQGGSEALSALLNAVRDPNITVNDSSLAMALSEYNGRAGVPLLLDFMQWGDNIDVLESAAFGIARNGDPEAVESLLTLLGGGSDLQRLAVANALREATPEVVSLDRLIDGLHNEADPEIGAEITRSIELLYADEGLSRVAEALDNTASVEARQAMVAGLDASWDHDPAAAQEFYLHVASLDPAPEVRRNAIEIIQNQEDPDLIPSLEALFAAEYDPALRDHLMHAIVELENLL